MTREEFIDKLQARIKREKLIFGALMHNHEKAKDSVFEFEMKAIENRMDIVGNNIRQLEGILSDFKAID